MNRSIPGVETTSSELSFAFTPEPWRVEPNYDNNRNGWTIVARGSAVGVASYLGGTEPAKANARLIAAAPELYRLLKRYRDETPPGHSPHMICHEVDALLAKVRGGVSA